MKKCRQFFVLFFVLTVFLSFGIGAWADGEYSYTVRVFGGNQGSVVNHATQANIPYDGSFTFNIQSDVTVTNSKYVVRGLRESGKDNSEIITPSSSTNEVNVRVVRDQDYVVAYGIPGNEVALTIRCTTADGTDLGVQEIFYGDGKTWYVEQNRIRCLLSDNHNNDNHSHTDRRRCGRKCQCKCRSKRGDRQSYRQSAHRSAGVPGNPGDRGSGRASGRRQRQQLSQLPIHPGQNGKVLPTDSEVENHSFGAVALLCGLSGLLVSAVLPQKETA